MSNNTVMACIQDKRGFVWFGTKEGLTRFDSYQFKIYLHNPSVPNCLINNYVTTLCEDDDGWIWIGTSEGICYYIPENDYFGSIKYENANISNFIIDVKADINNNIWIATFTGTYKYNKESTSLTFYPGEKYFTPRNINLTNAGDIWLSAANGKIYKYDERTDSFISYNILTEKEISASVQLLNILDAGSYGLIISSNSAGLKQFEPNSGKVTDLFKRDKIWSNIQIRTTSLYNTEEIWIGSESGIYIYNLKSGYVTNQKMVRTDPYSISNNAIRTITKDKEGGVWIGTFYGGVNYLPQENKPFEKFYSTGLQGSLDGNVVREIRADTYGNIWIGTEDAGLIKFDPRTRLFTNITDSPGIKDIESRNIQGLAVDNDDLWIGTYDKGIYKLNIPSGKIVNHFDKNDERSGLKTNSFITFLKTTDGTIYAGSVSGLYRFNNETSSFKFLNEVAAGTFIHSLYEDSKGNVWIGTYGRGLYEYDRSSGICRKILSVKGDYEGLENEFVTSIFEDNNHKIWFTTEGNGFSYIDPAKEVTRYIPGKDIDFAIYCAMLEDGRGNMWITSTRGLIRLDADSGKIITYTKDHGLLDNNFSYNSAFQDKNGKMYFGTVSGLVSFYPAEIKENTHNPPVILTGLQVNGIEYLINTTGSADFRSILVTNQIQLKHFQSSISIDFVSPGFTSPTLTKYKYKMEGSDMDWVIISGNRKVYYTNLSPGEYRFRVISSSDGNTWSSDETMLNIEILPPFWLSIPAYAFYIIISTLIIYTIIIFYLKKKALEQQRRIDIIETNKEKEILNAKISFFTNITHEVRTPLTLIKGPLDRILQSGIKNNSKDSEDNLLIIKRNTDRLLSLTNQLLDFRKTEKDIFKLNFIKSDLYELIESNFNLFLPYSSEKMVSFQLHSPFTNFNLAVDREAITKILSNLFSNALKFADTVVDVYLEPGTEKENIVRIRVNNDGKLIPQEFRDKIFEPFYQIDFDKPGQKGTGLGLSLARSLAELHNGKLYLDNNNRNYNSFVLELPKYQPESIAVDIGHDETDLYEHQEFEIFGSLENTRPNLLLVEDEIEMGRFISKEISGNFNVILTHNGEEALNALKKFNIILVISDVVMPVINGYELCRHIKSNIEFSHLPVILLTATIHLNAKIEGLDSGADAFIEKPFSTDLLIAQIINLIKNRSSSRQIFINSPLAHFKSVAMNKTDEEFLKKLHSTLMDNIAENELSVEKVASLMGLSISTLYRKVKALTDLNTVEYMRLTRLKKAAELLAEGNYRINEISYLVGFSSPSYFATSFQKQFGISPSQFIRESK